MLILPVPMFLASQEEGWPMASINVAALPAVGYGFILSGGIFEGLLGVSGGSISRSLVPGYVTDAVIGSGGAVQIIMQGDCEAVLSNITEILVDGVPYSLGFPFSYNSDDDYTGAGFIGDPWSGPGTHTIKLSEA